MNDRRDTPFSGRVAHVSLEGRVAAESFTKGSWQTVRVSVTPILDAPGGGRERELLFGQRFCVLDEKDGHAYGFAGRDSYCGWVPKADLGLNELATHRVAVRETYAKPTPVLKRTDPAMPLYLGSGVLVAGEENGWARIDGVDGPAYCPAGHLRPADEPAADPVAVALLFLGTPYLWGGNSGRGVDCSGLVQAAMLACGIACPGDSDQQAEALGDEIDPDAPRLRGDLWFWVGHVGILSAPDTLLHANAHRMMVAEEPLEEAIARIAAKEGKGVLCRRRVSRPRG